MYIMLSALYPNSPMNFHIFFGWILENCARLQEQLERRKTSAHPCWCLTPARLGRNAPCWLGPVGNTWGKGLEGIGRDWKGFPLQWCWMNLEQTHSWWPTYWSWTLSIDSLDAVARGFEWPGTQCLRKNHPATGQPWDVWDPNSGPFGSSLWKKSSLSHLTINHGVFSVFHQIHAFSSNCQSTWAFPFWVMFPNHCIPEP